MLKTLKTVLPAALLLVVTSGRMASAYERPDSALQAKMMAKAVELAAPGPEHKLLETLAGKWTFEATVWMEPGGEPMVVQGNAESRMILQGRFLMTESTGPSPFGGESENFGIMGFDRRFGHFTTIGMDTWGTYFVTAAGPYDSTTRTITMSGEDADPVFAGTQLYDFVLQLETDDTYTWQIIFKDQWHTRGGEPFKMVEMRFTRVE